MHRQYHLAEQPIPDGYQIYEERLPVAGIGFRKDDAARFARGSDRRLGWERDTGNKHDKNAIRILGISNGWFGIQRVRFIGFVPKEISKKLANAGLFTELRPRLLKTYVGSEGFVEVLFQIIGPKVHIERYREA